MAKRIQMRKNRFLAIQKIAEQKKGGGHDGHGHSHSHHSHHHGHGSISGHGALSGHGTLSSHGALSHNLSGHGLPSHGGTLSGHGYDGHRHSHGGHGGTLPGSMLSGDMDHAPRQTVRVVVKRNFYKIRRAFRTEIFKFDTGVWPRTRYFYIIFADTITERSRDEPKCLLISLCTSYSNKCAQKNVFNVFGSCLPKNTFFPVFE